MDRLDAMSIFVVAAEAGSLAAAARKLGRSPATVTRAIALLEKRLGQRLLHRTTRHLQLTEIGRRQAAVYRTVLAELDEAESGGQRAGTLDGTVGITASEIFGRLKVMPLIQLFLADHTAVRARVLLTNRVANLVEDGVDIAVRMGPLPDSGNVAVQLGEVRRLVCAAPSYVERVGLPDSPAALERHVCIGQEGNERELWPFARRSSSRNRPVSVAIHPRIALNSAGAAIEAAVGGSGICRALSHQVAEHIAAGRLVMVLPAFEPDPVPVHLVFHPIPRRNTTLRAFVDYATPRLRAALASISATMTRSGQP